MTAKKLISELSETLVKEFEDVELIDKYDVYEVLLSYWREVMTDDVYILIQDGYDAARETENILGVYTSGKNKGKEKVVGWEGKLIPKNIIAEAFFSIEKAKIAEAENIVAETESRLDEFTEEHAAEGGALFEFLNDKDKVVLKDVEAELRKRKKASDKSEETAMLAEFVALSDKVKEFSKLVKYLYAELDEKVREQYAKLTDEQVRELLVNKKWYYRIYNGIDALYTTVSHNIANRIVELTERYEDTLPNLEKEVEDYEAKVKSHLGRMGFAW